MPSIGFHLGNRDHHIPEPSMRVIDATKAKLLLPMDNILPDSIKPWAAKHPDGYLVLRKYYAKGQNILDWANGQVEMIDNYLKHPEIRTIYENERLGAKIFNEPNFDFEGWGWSDDALKRYNADFITASNYIKQRFPKAKSIIYSLAPGNGDVYFSGDFKNRHYWLHGPEAAKESPTQVEVNAAFHSCLTKDAKMAADWFGIHVYPLPGTWDKLWLGRRFERYWIFMPEHLVNNTFILEASVADDAGQETRANETYEWLKLLRKYPNIKGIALWWLRNGDSTWEKHFYTNIDGSFRPVANKVIQFVSDFGSSPSGSTPEPQPDPKPEPDTDFPQRVIDAEASSLNMKFDFADEQGNLVDGEYYYRLDSLDIIHDGTHHALFEVYDSNGNPLQNEICRVIWPDGVDEVSTNSNGEANIAVWAEFDPDEGQTGPYSANVKGNIVDVVHGLGLPEKQHVSYKMRFTKYLVKVDEEPQPPEEPPMTIEQTVRNAAWNKTGVALNRDAYFYKYATKYSLGRPVTGEFDIFYGRRKYRVQAFNEGIVFSEVVDGNVILDATDHIDWT